MPDADARVALVTGATGFVGSHLTEALVRRGWRVRCLTRRTSSTGWLPLDHVELVQADVGDPSPDTRSALASAMRGVDVVFHLAAVTSAATDDEYFRVNVDGTRRMATMMGEVAPEAHFVLCSSLAAAGPPRPGRPAREGDRDSPQSAYGRSKLFSEQVLAA